MKNKLRNKIVILTLVVLASVFGCEKSEDNEEGIVQCHDELKLIQIVYDTVVLYEYTYTDSGLINEDKSKYFYRKYNYNGKNQLTSIDVYEDPAFYSSNWEVVEAANNRNEWINPTDWERSYEIKYNYDSNDMLSSSSNYLGVWEYKYDEKNRINNILFYHDNRLSHSIEHEYDSRGNLIRETNFSITISGDKELFKEYEFEFDNNCNPYKAFKINVIPGRYTNPNNEIKRTYCYPDIQQKDIYSTTTKTFYEYNSYGYPILKNDEIEYIYE